MFDRKTLLRAMITVSLTSGLIACGGGSSSDETTSSSSGSETETQTGRFVDSPVGGMEYAALPSGVSGITNDNGEFKYISGDEVSFKVGQFNIGKVEASSLITPLTLIPEANGSTANVKVQNIARFLQTLDDDGIPDNGITITEAVRAVAANQNPADVSTANFGTDSALKTAVLAAAAKTAAKTATIVSVTDAIEHLDGTLAVLDPVQNCSDDRAVAVESSRISGKTFGYIKTDEIGIFEFKADGTFHERSYDSQRTGTIRDDDATVNTWTVSTADRTITLYGEETHTVCATDSYLIFENQEGVSKFYDVAPYSLPESDAETFLVSFGDEKGGLLEVSAAGSLDYFPTETPIDSSSAGAANTGTGALDLDFKETDVNGSPVIDEVFFLAGQGKRTGVYLDYYNENGALGQVGTATIVPGVVAANEATFTGQTFVYHSEEANETIILTYNSDGTFDDFHNDCYSNGTQEACHSQAEWTWNTAEATLTETYSAADSTTSKVVETGSTLYFGIPSDEEVVEVSKTKDIIRESFVGNYTVDIPTENTRFNSLDIEADGTCTYSGVDCTWQVNTGGEAQIDFASGDETARIWQLAGSVSSFAFLMTHSGDENDIEPGFMTRN